MIENNMNKINKALGGEEEKTIFEIADGNDKNEKMLTLKSGSWSSKEPWFGIDENKNLHTMVSIKSLNNLIEAYKKLAKENFDLRLEKSIAGHLPINFGDVWTVCMDDIQKIALANPDKSVLNLNLNAVVSNVKKNHPNLFINIENIIKERGKDI